MARPRVPLISKRKALEVALDLIDQEGIAALSIRRLADRLNVNGASLYHHFENKEEILFGVAKIALEGVHAPQDGQDTRAWLLSNVRRLRQAFRDHPDLVPVMLRLQPLGVSSVQMEETAALLEEDGVPQGAIAPMLEALELYAIVSALHERRDQDVVGHVQYDSQQTPHLKRAASQRSVSADEVFDVVCAQVVEAIERTSRERAESKKPTEEANTGSRRTRRKKSST